MRAMRMPSLVFAVVLVLGPAWPAAGSIAPYRTDAQLVAISDRVVHGRVIDNVVEQGDEGLIRTRTRVAVLEDFTGGADAVLTIYELGGQLADGSGMSVPGAPRFVRGEHVVLCLERTTGGFRTVAMGFSAFRVADARSPLVRLAGEMSVVGGPDHVEAERTLDSMRRVVAAVKGVAPRLVSSATDAAARLAASPVVAEPYTLLEFGRRWREVDQGRPIRFYLNGLMPSPVQNADTEALIRLALEAWTAPVSANVVLEYGGVAFDRGPSTNRYCTNINEGIALLTFGDPGDLLPTGIVSSSGGCYGGFGHVYNNYSFGHFTHAWSLVNGTDTIGPYAAPPYITMILQHEFGHAIGLGHSCWAGEDCSPKRGNIMFPAFSVPDLPRPPDLGFDDLAGLAFIYGRIACTFTVSPATATVDAIGGEGRFTVTPSDPTCGWDAAATTPWLVVTEGARGVGPGTVRYASSRWRGPVGAIAVGNAMHTVTRTLDTDADTDQLLDSWERFSGLNAASSAGEDGATGDADADGISNRDELLYGTHPKGTFVRYFAEGAQNAFFDTEFALFNPGDAAASVWVTPQPEGVGNATGEFALPVLVPPHTRRTIPAAFMRETLNWPFSTRIESNVPVVVDRTMRWDANGYGAHAETATAAPSTTWYLAEGSTSGEFSLFYLLQNPMSTATVATVRFLRPAPLPPIERSYAVAANARLTIPVDGVAPELASTDVSGVVTATQPIIVERAMYLNRPNQAFGAGHGSAGVPAPATEWFLAEGATGTFFDLFVLIANPGTQPALVTVDYLLPGGGTLSKVHTVAPESRYTIYVDDEQVPAGSGRRPLAATAVSVRVTSTNGTPIVVERSMWWPQPAWYEAHNAPGLTTTGTRWALAAGESGGGRNAETYVLIANTSASAGTARVTICFEDGASLASELALPAQSRTSVSVRSLFPAAAGRRYATLIESVGGAPVPIVVERAMYESVLGVMWSAGTAAVATRLTP
jgi:hypothetical protein